MNFILKYHNTFYKMTTFQTNHLKITLYRYKYSVQIAPFIFIQLLKTGLFINCKTR